MVYVVNHSDDWGIDGAVRHMSSAYALDDRKQYFCELDPYSFGAEYAVCILCPHPHVDSHAITGNFAEAGWIIGPGKYAKHPRRYDVRCSIADTILMEGGATMTDLLGSKVSYDVRCLRTGHRRLLPTRVFHALEGGWCSNICSVCIFG